MSFQPKSIQCSECGTTFTLSADEQELFTSRGYTNDPKHCSWCRAARKIARYGDSSYGYGSGPRRQMFRATCAKCGKDTRLPFEPRQGRPVYCSECYGKVRVNR